MVSGAPTHMMRGEVKAPSRGHRTPRGCCPLSYIKGGGTPPLFAPWVPLPFPLLLLHRHDECLVAKLCQNISSTLTLGEVEEEFQWIPTSAAPLDEGMEVFIEPYVWPSTEVMPVVALIFAILRSMHDRLHLYRQCLCWNVIPLSVYEG
jgi:hypothetical protein